MSEPALDELRGLLEAERTRITAAIAYLQEDSQRTMDDEIGDFGGRGVDNHPADMATVTHDRELDEGLGEGAQQTLDQIDRALAKLDGGRLRHVRAVRRADRRRAPEGATVGHALYRRPAAGGSRLAR